MTPAEPFPLFFPGDARRPFESEDPIRRFARTANLSPESRVLELGCGRGMASLLLAREFGCDVLAVDSDERALQQLNEQVRASALADRLHVRRADPTRPALGDGEFDGILIHGRVLFPIAVAVRLRRYLALRGRLGLTYPVRVGRYPNRAAVEFWETRLGEPLLLPRELLQALEKGGFEPEGVETLSDAELGEHYRLLETRLGVVPGNDPLTRMLREEIELFRSQGGKASVTYAMALGRRKEPGEKPPASRDRG